PGLPLAVGGPSKNTQSPLGAGRSTERRKTSRSFHSSMMRFSRDGKLTSDGTSSNIALTTLPFGPGRRRSAPHGSPLGRLGSAVPPNFAGAPASAAAFDSLAL